MFPVKYLEVRSWTSSTMRGWDINQWLQIVGNEAARDPQDLWACPLVHLQLILGVRYVSGPCVPWLPSSPESGRETHSCTERGGVHPPGGMFCPTKKLSPCNRRDCYAISNLGVFYFVFLSMFMFKTQIQRTFTFKIVVTSRQCFFKNHFKLYLKMEWHWFILIH